MMDKNQVAQQEDEGQKPGNVPEVDQSSLTQLPYHFCFWFSYFKEQRMKQAEDYETNIKKIGSFSTAEEFWGYYQHIRRPDSLPKCCEFFLFKDGVRPLWEDPANKGGGRFVIHVKRIFANKTWEDIIIAFIIANQEYGLINGVVINVRSWEVLLSIWMSPLPAEEDREKYRHWLRQSLGMTDSIKIDYKEHPNPEDVKKASVQEKEAKEGEAKVAPSAGPTQPVEGAPTEETPVETPEQQA